ncbi:MAG: hypothetical protein V1911_01670 [Candidatus Micrarchaeota archaeon]
MDFHHQKVGTGMKLEEMLRIVYPGQQKYRAAAAWLISEAGRRSEGLDGYELAKLCDEKSISRATMQKVFVRLRSLGLIERREMRYFLNKEFSSAVRRLGESWRNIINENKFDFDENTLKLNI